MSNSTVTQLSARIDALDTILFRRNPWDEEQENHAIRNTAIGAGVAGVGGYAGYRGGQRVGNRMGGMRATVPGFTSQPKWRQAASATASVARDASEPIMRAGQGAASYARRAATPLMATGKRLARKVFRWSTDPTERVLQLAAKAEEGLVEFKVVVKDRDERQTYAGTGAQVGAGIGAATGVFQPEGERLRLRVMKNAYDRGYVDRTPGLERAVRRSAWYAKGGVKQRLAGAAGGAVVPGLLGAGIGALVSRKKERERRAR